MQDHASSGNGTGRPAPLPLTIQDRSYEWADQYITGAQVRKLGGIAPNQDLFLSLADPYPDESITPDAIVNLARPGLERFYIRQPLEYKLSGKSYFSNKPLITGAELREAGHVEDGDEIWLSVPKPYDDQRIEDQIPVDLTRDEIENFYIKPLLVIISINDAEHKIARGEHTITELKKLGSVNPVHEVDQLKGHQLIPLADNAIVSIRGGEQFISHVRDGSSS